MISYKSSFVQLKEQQLVYDLNAIVAAVGGGFGLFLGASVYGLVSDLVDYLLYDFLPHFH